MNRVTLSWVHQDIEDQLTRVRHDLDAFSQGERERLHKCAAELHRIHGVVQMLGHYGLALLLQELESLAVEIDTGRVKAIEEACELMTAGVLQLSDYLNRVDAGEPDAPYSLVPLLNDLRSVRRQPLLSESILFSPRLDATAPLRNRRPPLDGEQFRSYVRRLRTYYQHGLVGWFQGKSDDQGIMLLRAVVAQLERLSGDAPCGKLWWVAGGIVEALRDGGLSTSVAIRRLLAQFDAWLRNLADVGAPALNEPPPPDLLKNLLYYVTRATSDGGRVSAVRDIFDLDALVFACADGASASHIDADAKETIAAELQDQIATLRELLDSWARDEAVSANQIDSVAGQLGRAADAFALLNFGLCHALLTEQVHHLHGLSGAGEQAGASTLAAISHRLDDVDTAVAEAVQRAGISESSLDELELGRDPGDTQLSEHALAHLTRTVIREANRELTDVKRIIDSQLRGESADDGMEAIATSVHRVAGSLRMVRLTRAADLIEEWVGLVRPVLRAADGDTGWVALDAMAEVLVGLERYLAGLLGHEPDVDSLLALTERRLDEFRDYTRRLRQVKQAHGSVRASSLPPSPASAVTLVGLEESIEDDIVAVFSSEAREVIQSLQDDIGRWAQQLDDSLVLADVRRGFHTLKGSGRLVGAYELGELCWIVESLLNQVIEGVCTPTEAVRELVVSAWHELPALLSAFERGETASFELAAYSVKATRALYAGRSASPGQDNVDDAADVRGAVEAPAPPPASPEPSPAAASLGATDERPPGGDDAEPDSVTEDPRQLFWQEAIQSLDFVGSLLRQWATMPDDRQCVLELQRELHTLKGGARMANLEPFGNLGHAMESALMLVGEGRIDVTDELFELIERCYDRLQDVLELAGEGHAIEEASDLMGRLETLVQAAEPRALAPRSKGNGAKPSPASSAPLPGGDPKAGHGPGLARRVQVPANFLDSLAHYAGDIGLSQSRLGQQFGAYRANLEELERTVGRLKDQLRRLELNAPAAHPARGGNGVRGAEFDARTMERQARARQLAGSLNESVSDLESIQGLMQSITDESDAILEHQIRISKSLQQGLVRTRTVSISGLVDRFRRLVRRTMHDLGKRVELRIEGGDLQLDRAIVELLTPSLEHMLRNAVDHGIESPQARVAAGKPPTGAVRLSFARVGSELEIQVMDDGCGVRANAMRSKAVERGVLDEHARPSEEELYQLILEPGISTASRLTQISGRGVGLDAVNARVKALGGTLGIESRPDAGCTFTIRVPFTPALNQALLVDVGEETMALPLGSIRAVARMTSREFVRLRSQRAPRYEHAGRRWPLVALGELLGFGPSPESHDQDRATVVLVGTGDSGVALEVDALVGRHEIAIKSLSPQLSAIRWVTGATILGDGRVAMILNIPALVRRGLSRHRERDGVQLASSGPAARQGPPKVLIVDDSITVRKITQRLLNRHGMDVLTARDGEEALALLEEHGSDLMLLDIEMPRMDGFQVIESVRANQRFKSLPIVVITSRSGAKHSKYAKEMGVDRYIGKPYVEEELLRQIHQILGER